MNRILARHLLVMFVMSMWSITPTPAQEYRYAWIRLPGVLNGGDGIGTGVGGINASGVVAGGAVIGPTRYDEDAAYWDTDGNLVRLESLGGQRSSAGPITDRGDLITGRSVYPGGNLLRSRGVFWRDGKITDMGTLGGEATNPLDVNNSEQIVGWSHYNLEGHGAAFVWENGQLRELPNFGFRPGGADGINEYGDIVGGLADQNNVRRAVLWRGGVEIEILPDLGGLSAPAVWDINDHGVIVGSAETPNEQFHAVVWANGQIFDIHTPGIGSNTSHAMDINNSNQVIGVIGDAFNSRAFIWEQGSRMLLLDDLVPPSLRRPWIIQPVLSINNAGQIAANAEVPPNLDRWAVLLSPVYPTMDMQAPQPGTAGEANTITVTNATPGARVHFLYSKNGGGTRIPGCDLQQNALQLDSPTLIGTAIADGSGVATITRTVPLLARGQTILFQAVVQNECAISQLVVHRFE